MTDIEQANPMEQGSPVVVVGLGAIGGSVAKAVRARWPDVPLLGIETDPIHAANARGDGIRVAQRLPEEEVDGSVLVYATPLDVTVQMIETESAWTRAVLAMDVASLKAPVLDAVDARDGTRFVGAHPMCGTHHSGYAAGSAELFEGVDVWLCPSHRGADALPMARAFWRALGAVPQSVSRGHHDHTMVWASHLPQLAASALASTLSGAGLDRGALGPGGRDMTRLARSSASMWGPLLRSAARADAEALLAFEKQVRAIRMMLEENDFVALDEIMNQGRAWTKPES